MNTKLVRKFINKYYLEKLYELKLLYNIKVRKKKSISPNLIISFPKSGRTWLRTLIGKYYELNFNIDFTTETHLIKPDKYSIGFSHFIPEVNRHKKIVILVRDPKDTIVSYYHQISKREDLFKGDISKFIRSKRFGIRKINKFLNTLFRIHQNNNNNLIISYEMLHEDTEGTLKKVLIMFGVPINDKNIKKAVNFCKFENMQKMEKADKFINDRLKTKNKKDINNFKTRKGKVGSYKEELSESDILYIDSYSKEIYKKLIQLKKK
jgi:hypothetical protein